MKKGTRWMVPAVILVVLLLMTGTVQAETFIRGQLIQLNRPVTVETDEVIQGDVVVFFGTADVHGTVEGDLVGIFSPVKVEGGTIEGQVVTLFAPLTLREAQVSGDAVSIAGGVRAESGTSVTGNAVGILGFGLRTGEAVIGGHQVDLAGFLPERVSGFGLLSLIIASLLVLKQLVALFVGVLAIVLFPERFERMADRVFLESGRKTLMGLLIQAGAYVLLVVLVISMIGAALVPFLLVALMLLEFAGNTTIKIGVGRKIAGGLGQNWGTITELIAGTLVYILLEVSLVGKLLTFVLKLTGMGEMVDSRFGDPGPVVDKGGVSNAS